MLSVEKISELQNEYGLAEMQELINSGQCWKFEGSYGRAAMSHLESGACLLPNKNTYDYYGNLIPSRGLLEEGTKGTLENSQNFWQKVIDGEIEIDEPDDFEEYDD